MRLLLLVLVTIVLTILLSVSAIALLRTILKIDKNLRDKNPVGAIWDGEAICPIYRINDGMVETSVKVCLFGRWVPLYLDPSKAGP